MKERKQKTLAKRLLVALLSVMMTVTFIPTSLLAFAAEPEATPDDGQNGTQTEVVQDDVQTEATEATKPAVSEPKQETKKGEPEKGSTNHFSEEVDEMIVDVDTEKDAFDEDVSLKVKPIKEGSKAYKEAEEALEENEQVYAGMLAFDIHFENSKGKEVEPNGAVSVKMTAKKEGLKDVDPKAFNAETVQVSHIVGKKAEVVADTNDKNKIDGTVEVEKTKKAVESIDAEFEVDSFSTFALTWTGGEATIHWGTIGNDGSFNEFDAASLDDSVGSVDLRASYSGYEYVDAVLYTTKPSKVDIDASTTVSGRTFINDVITKENATGSTSGYHWLAEDSHNNAQTFAVGDGNHIYAVYAKPDPAHPHGPTPEQSDDIPTPTTNKTVSTNKNPDGTPDGTYTIELDITGKQIPDIHQTGANVVIIYDISQSMSQSVGGMTRLEASRRATHTLINTLKPGTNDIDLALITFAQDAQTRTFNGSNWTKNGTNITNVVDGITNVGQNLGTSWHEALQNAYNLTPPDDDPTYVIFITDGCPSVNGLTSSGHSHGAAGTNNETDLCYTAAVAYSKMIAGTKGQSYSTRVTSGNNNWNITGTGKGEYLYGIYTGTDSNNMLGKLVTASNGTSVITATSESEINNAFKNIAQTIVNNLGATGVTTTDGVTELSSISADVHGTTGAFEYYRKGGKNEDGTEKYDHTANNGLGETWDDAPGVIYNEDGSVTWDLSSVGTAEADVTYVVRFTVWPSQEAYDIIANLNNKAIKYDDLPDDVQTQIYEAGGKYYLKTNTTLNTSYTFQGQTYTDPVQFEQGQMVLDETEMTVRKDFANDINKEHVYDEIEFYLLRDGKYYQKDGTVSDTLNDSKVYKMPVNADNDWTNSIFIAPGVMKDGEVLETGHKYSLDEKILVGNEYEYEFTPQTVRPMEINGHLAYLVLVDKYNPAPSGATTYYIDDSAKTYRPATSSDTENVYYVASGSNNGTLVGTNRKTAELDITKKIVDKTGNFTEKQLDAETFTYRVTLTVPKDGDISGITAYEYVPRYDDPLEPGRRFKVFGYQSNEDETVRGFTDDVSRFTGKVHGGWTVTTPGGGNTLEHVFTENEDGSKTATIDITLKRNEIIRFTNLPADTEYEIVEMYNNYRQADPSLNANATGSDMAANIADQGYSTSVATKSRNPVAGTARNGSVQGTTVSGTIDYLDVRYYNQFTNTLNDVIDVELTGTKHLVGYEWSGERYYYNLAAKDNAPLPLDGAYGRTRFYLTEPNGSADKSYSFGKIRFTEAGTYEYTISEDGAGEIRTINGKQIVFDTAKTIIIEVVSDDSGKLSVKSVTGDDVEWTASKLTANVTLTNKLATKDIPVQKIWADLNDVISDKITAVIIELQDEAGNAITDASGQALRITLNADNNWKNVFSNLPIYDANGDPITYKIAEVAVMAAQGDGNVDIKDLFEVAYGTDPNDETVQTVTNTKSVTSVKVNKIWNDSNDQDGKRANVNATVQLYERVGTEGQEQTVGNAVNVGTANNWTYTWDNLPVKKGGVQVYYTVKETLPAASGYTTNYTAEYKQAVKDGEVEFSITNSYTPAKTTVKVTKAWEDTNNQDKLRPESISMQLFANGNKKGDAVTLDADHGWTYTWTGLDVNAGGKAIEYTVDETAVPRGYTKTVGEVTGDADNGFEVKITNKLEIEYVAEGTSFDIIKKDQDGKPMSGVEFVLSNGLNGDLKDEIKETTNSDGKATIKIDVDEAGKWLGTDERVKDSYEYTLTEKPVTGYDAAGPWNVTIVPKKNADGTIPTYTIKDIETSDGGTKSVWQRFISWITGDIAGPNAEFDGEKLILNVTNTASPEEVTVTKTFDGIKLADAPENFAINVTYTDVDEGASELALTTGMASTDNVKVTTSGNTVTWKISNVRYGTDFKAEEVGYTKTGYKVTPTVTATGSATDPVYVVSDEEVSGKISVPANNNAVVAFANKYEFVEVIINKSLPTFVNHEGTTSVNETETNAGASFAYRVMGYDAVEGGNKILDTTIGIDLSKPGNGQALLGKISPDVKRIEVVEVYAGNYTAVQEDATVVTTKLYDGTTTDADGNKTYRKYFEVSFENTWSDDITYKTGVTNKFKNPINGTQTNSDSSGETQGGNGSN